jgi:putative DNA primase/helicase
MTAFDVGQAVSARLAEQGYGRNGQQPDEPDDQDYEPDEPDETTAAERPVFPAPDAPLDVARQLYRQYRIGADRTLLAWRGSWMRWETTRWRELDAAELRSGIYATLGNADYKRPLMEKGVVVGYERVPWHPDKRKVANVIEAMAAVGHLSAETDTPSWIGIHSAAETPAAQMISCENGLLDLSTRAIHNHTPALFNVVAVPFAYDASAPKPVAWLEFLESVWPDDEESVALLQEYIGYVLSGRTDMQKLLLLIGPTRSGKGTIARMLVSLIGRGHAAGPTLASLGTNFGLSPLLGKPLAIISDARLGDTPAHTVVERLLSITGEDMLTVDRKFRDPWSGKLPTRFVILTNELPRFRDSSAAIANRMLILQMTQSFLGCEDRTLDARLRGELWGILLWALAGLDRLNANDRFTVPDSSQDAANLMADLASPMSAFVRDCCVRGPNVNVAVDDLYTAWKTWAINNGHHAGAKSTFGRNLRAVVPELKMSQPRVDGSRERRYERVGLRVCNAEDPVPPVPDDESVRDTGYPAPEDDAEPQVNGGGTGGTGAGPLHAYSAGSGTSCTGCGTALERQVSRERGLCTQCWTTDGGDE